MAVLWSSDDDRVVVWYYDVEAAKAEATATGKAIEEQDEEIEKQEEEMVHYASAVASGQSNPGNCPEPLERSTVMEIRKWIYGDREAKRKRASE